MRLKAYRKLVDARLEELLPPVERTPSELHAAMRYSCLAPGKRVRPALCLAAAGGHEQPHPSVVDAACALEMVHSFSLIHDDLPAIDDDELRRGVPTCHMKFGEALALLAGDALFGLAFQVMASLDTTAERSLRCTRLLASSSGSDGLVGGEVLDVLAEGKPARADTVELIHTMKTGRLIEASCEIGALLGGSDEPTVDRLRSFGRHLGLAFQIADDLLNELSSAEALGKAAGTDRERMKATYPAVHGIAGAQAEAEARLQRAVAEISGLPNEEELVSLARYVVHRVH